MGAKVADLWQPKLDVEGDERAAVARALSAVYEPMMVSMAVIGYKRRLGAVTGDRLARDKRTARQVAAAYFRVYMTDVAADWNTLREAAEQDDEIRRQAGVVSWPFWLVGKEAELRAAAIWCATWVMKINLRSDIVKQFATRLDYAAGRLCVVRERLSNE
jgi:hypothetical protein